MATNYNKVIWSEGMFLRHEHFQQQDRYLESVVTISKKVEQGSHFYGFSELELENDLLALGKIRLAKFAGSFPDGTAFHCRNNCALLEAIEIKKDTNNCIVYLCLPLQNSSQIEIDSQNAPEFLARYRIENTDVLDGNTSTNVPYNMTVGRLFVRLMLETQDRSQYACLAVAKIKEVSLSGEILLDKDFIPISINIKISSVVNQFLEKLCTAVSNRYDDLSSRLNRPERYETTYITDFMLLQALCRYQSLALYWYQSDYLHPEILYIELLKLQGDLAVFSQQTNDLKKFTMYQHQNLQATYAPLMELILDGLLSVLNQRAIQLELLEQESGRYVAKTGDWAHLKTTEIVVAVKADMPTEHLHQAFINQIKIAPAEFIDQLITSHLPGIGGTFLTVTPPELPYHSGYSYFKLNKNSELYREIAASIGLSVHIGGYFPNLDLTVWVIKN